MRQRQSRVAAFSPRAAAKERTWGDRQRVVTVIDSWGVGAADRRGLIGSVAKERTDCRSERSHTIGSPPWVRVRVRVRVTVRVSDG